MTVLLSFEEKKQSRSQRPQSFWSATGIVPVARSAGQSNADSGSAIEEKKQMTLARAHNRDAVPLRYTSFLERLICNTIKRWDRATPSLPFYFSWLAVSCLLG